MARGLKFRIYKVEGLYYLSSENKGADQHRGHREADLRLCFCIYAKLLFSHDATQMIFRSAKAGIDVTPIHIFDTETLIRKI